MGGKQEKVMMMMKSCLSLSVGTYFFLTLPPFLAIFGRSEGEEREREKVREERIRFFSRADSNGLLAPFLLLPPSSSHPIPAAVMHGRKVMTKTLVASSSSAEARAVPCDVGPSGLISCQH